MKKVLLKIGGMSCSACSTGLEKFLNKQEGIKNATINLVMNNANIEYDDTIIDVKNIEEYIKKAGFESLGIDNFKQIEKEEARSKNKLIILTVLSILIFYISMAHMVGLPSIPFLHMMKQPVNYSITLYIGKDILKNGYKNLIHKTPNMDTLVMIGVVSAFIYSIYGTVMILNGNITHVEHLYYESAAIVIFFIKIGKYIEGKNKTKTKAAIANLMKLTPNKATIMKEGKQIEVTIDEIEKGDIVICKPGEKIAVDGVITQGITHIDESFITGESIPVKKEEKMSVIAGSINYEGTIQYKAEKIGKDSTVSEIVRLVVEATNTKAPIAKVADKISGYFVPIIIIIAIIFFVFWLLMQESFAFAINIFITLLVIACPCALGLATPLAIVIASGISASNGLLIKNSAILENAHKIDTIVFDKTGTLTKGSLNISKIYIYNEQQEREIIKQIASIENKSEHPIARAIVNYAKKEEIELKEVKDFKAIPGRGVVATYDNKKVLIGNKQMMIENDIKVDNEQDENDLVTKGNSILFVAVENELISLVGVKDMLRQEAKEVIEKLNKKNIEIIMLTGDNEKTAKVIASTLGIDKVIANLVPVKKTEQIEKIKKEGKQVMMVGDGINDAPSLVTANIGVAIGSGTDIAIDSADVVLMNTNLNKINDLINLSKKTIVNIKQNLFWAFFYNIAMIPIAAGLLKPIGIVMNPMFAGFAMTISSLTVVFNALRLRRVKFSK